MNDPRWTDETVELVARVLAVGAYDTTSEFGRETFHVGATAILTALGDAGLLVAPAASRCVRTRTEGSQFVDESLPCTLGPDHDGEDHRHPQGWLWRWTADGVVMNTKGPLV